jgi:hypothetical protein
MQLDVLFGHLPLRHDRAHRFTCFRKGIAFTHYNKISGIFQSFYLRMQRGIVFLFANGHNNWYNHHGTVRRAGSYAA